MRASVACAIAILVSPSLAHATQMAEPTAFGRPVEDVFRDPAVASLARAACHGSAEGVARALAGGASINAVSHLAGVPERPADASSWEYEETPLTWAIRCDNPAGVLALLKAGADPNQLIYQRTEGTQSGFHDTPVIRAADKSSATLLALLLDHGGDPNASMEGAFETALSVAFDVGENQAIDAMQPDDRGHAPAAKSGGFETYNLLLRAGADINRVHNGYTIMDEVIGRRAYGKALDLVERGFSNLIQVGFLLDQNGGRDEFPENLALRNQLIARLRQKGVEFPILDHYALKLDPDTKTPVYPEFVPLAAPNDPSPRPLS